MEDSDKSKDPIRLENLKLKRKNSIYQEAVEYYADPLNPYDGGEKARQAIKNLSNPNYKFNRLKDFVFNPLSVDYDLSEDEDEQG